MLRITAAYVPYYLPADHVLGVLSTWPDPRGDHSHGLRNGELGLHDSIVTEMAVQMHGISSVKGLMRYLHGVEPVLMCSEQWKADVSMVPLLRLQGELYSLTLPGGPRCAAPCLEALVAGCGPWFSCAAGFICSLCVTRISMEGHVPLHTASITLRPHQPSRHRGVQCRREEVCCGIRWRLRALSPSRPCCGRSCIPV